MSFVKIFGPIVDVLPGCVFAGHDLSPFAVFPQDAKEEGRGLPPANTAHRPSQPGNFQTALSGRIASVATIVTEWRIHYIETTLKAAIFPAIQELENNVVLCYH